MKVLPFMANTIPDLRFNRHYSPGPDAPSYTTGNPLDDIVLFKASAVMGDKLKTRLLKTVCMRIL